MNQQETLAGTIERFIYKNDENGFSIAVLHLTAQKTTIVTGFLAHVHPGQYVSLQGAWVMHAKFGRQFEAKTCQSEQPTSIIGLKKYLGSGLIKGIGKVYAEKLVDHFGAEVLRIIEHEPERLSGVPGIGSKRLEMIVHAWQSQKEIATIMVFLQDKGVSTAYASKIFKTYGKESIAKVTENPYRLAEDIWGVGFKSADKIAQQLGFAPHSVQRIKAGIAYVISEASNQGHLYLELPTLKEQIWQLLEIEQDIAEPIIKIALHELYNAEKIKLLTHDEKHYITLSKFYFTERGVAQKIIKLMDRSIRVQLDLDTIYQELRVPHEGEIALNDDQQAGIMRSLQSKVGIITGGPGTGKTTLIKKLLTILDANKLRYRLAAPTGRAAKRMQEGTGKPAETIHRLLGFDPKIMNFTHNEQDALKIDFLIVDEASMIDIFLAHALLKAMPADAHILFIGDIDQLPSVGAGNFLGDMIASGKVPYTRLTQIFRQAQDSMIILNAHKINQGEFPASFVEGARRDYFYIKEDQPEMVIEHIKKIFSEQLKRFHIQPHDATVLVPMNRGIAGTIKLNQDLQLFLNPDPNKKQLMHTGTLYRVGDKVMQIRNDYDKLVFNGDIGFVEDINVEDRQMIVNVDGRLVEYEIVLTALKKSFLYVR